MQYNEGAIYHQQPIPYMNVSVRRGKRWRLGGGSSDGTGWCCRRFSPSKIDRCSRSGFPLLFIGFNCLYWFVFHIFFIPHLPILFETFQECYVISQLLDHKPTRICPIHVTKLDMQFLIIGSFYNPYTNTGINGLLSNEARYCHKNCQKIVLYTNIVLFIYYIRKKCQLLSSSLLLCTS